MQNANSRKLFQVLHTFQSVMECNLYPSKKSILVLSDNGSTGSFVDTNLMDSLAIKPFGQWTGILKTMLQEEKMQIPFYKLEMSLSQDVRLSDSSPSKDSNIPIWALGSPNIGARPQIPESVINYLASIFQVPPDMLCSRAANLGMLIGLDCNQFLLKPLNKINGVQILVPHEASNLTLNASKLSNLLSVVGTIGPPSSGLNLGDARTFRMNLKPEKGLFSFFTEPSDQDIESIKNQFENHLVETFPRFDVPALPSPATTTTKTSDTVHNQLFSSSDFPALPPPSKESHTEEIRTQIFYKFCFFFFKFSFTKKEIIPPIKILLNSELVFPLGTRQRKNVFSPVW